MAWSSPRTWSGSETVTAALFNQEIRDNLLYLGGTDGSEKFHKIAETVLGSDAANVSFASIPATFRNLMIVWRARVTTVGAANSNMWVRINGDTGNNYDGQQLNGIAAAAAAAEFLAQAGIICGRIPNDGATTSYFGGGVVEISDYAATDKCKTVTGVCVSAYGTTTQDLEVGTFSGLWRTINAAINTLLFFPNADSFKAGSVFTLYGVP